MGIPDGLALWERYNLSAACALSGSDVFVTDYESLVFDPRRRIREIAEWLASLAQFEEVSAGWDLPGAETVSLANSNINHYKKTGINFSTNIEY